MYRIYLSGDVYKAPAVVIIGLYPESKTHQLLLASGQSTWQKSYFTIAILLNSRS